MVTLCINEGRRNQRTVTMSTRTARNVVKRLDKKGVHFDLIRLNHYVFTRNEQGWTLFITTVGVPVDASYMDRILKDMVNYW